MARPLTTIKHDSIPEGFPRRLLEAVGDRSLNQFARDCGVSLGAVRRCLLGKSEPVLGTLVHLAKGGKCRVGWLAAGEKGGAPDLSEASVPLRTLEDCHRKIDDLQRIIGRYALEIDELRKKISP